MSFFYEHLSDTENFFLLRKFKNCWVNSHFHKSYEFVYIISGKCEVFANDKTSVAEAGDIFCVPSFCIHNLKSVGDTEILTLVFEKNYFDDFVKDYGGDFFAPTLANKEKNREIYGNMTDFLEKHGENGGKSYLQRKIFIDTLMCSLCETYDVTPFVAQKHNQNICDVLTYIDTHFSEKITLGMLAENFGYNCKYFSSYFNKAVGTNVNDYINNIRYNRAKLLLDNTDMSVSEVMKECGFESLATFYRTMNRYSAPETAGENTDKAVKPKGDK